MGQTVQRNGVGGGEVEGVIPVRDVDHRIPHRKRLPGVVAIGPKVLSSPEECGPVLEALVPDRGTCLEIPAFRDAQQVENGRRDIEGRGHPRQIRLLLDDSRGVQEEWNMECEIVDLSSPKGRVRLAAPKAMVAGNDDYGLIEGSGCLDLGD